MSIYCRDDVNPEWEPDPWDLSGEQVDLQEQGFHERAQKPLVWTRIDFSNFPKTGIFGRDRDWFVAADVNYFTVFDGEDLILIRKVWFGFPDPPEWGLASRSSGHTALDWKMWGYFPKLPVAWVVPLAYPEA